MKADWYTTVLMPVRFILLICFISILLAASPVIARAADAPNVVLITLDSTRTDRMSFLGGRGQLTPNLDRLAHDSLTFDRAYAQAPSTLPSDTSILTGTYSQVHHVMDIGIPLSESIPYLPDLLHAHGYHTAAFVSSSLMDPKSGLAPGFARGFETYESGLHTSKASVELFPVSRTPVLQVISHSLNWTREKIHAPFFLWIHLDDALAPPACAHGASSSYDRAISCSDEAIGKLTDALRTSKLYDDALIVVVANHGESLGAHGEDTHGAFLYDETIHVPLLVKLPAAQMAGRHIASSVQLVDIAPTILEVARVPIPSTMQGQSLLRTARNATASNRPAYARTEYPSKNFGWSALESWRSGNYLLIRAPHPELYEVASDPGATHNLAESKKAVFATLASQLESFDRQLSGTSSGASANVGLSSAELQKLASLGYVGLQRSAGKSDFAVGGVDPKDRIGDANNTEKAIELLREGHPEKSSGILQKVVGDERDSFLPLYTLAVAEIAQRHFDQAVAHLRKAIALAPESALAHYAMAVALSKQADWKTAVVHLEIVVARLPQFAEAHNLLADAYTRVGRPEDARGERAKAGIPQSH